MEKPKKKHPRPACYNYIEVQQYLEALHSKDFRNYAGRKHTGLPDDPPYLDFWHWMLDHTEAHNGGYIYIPCDFANDSETPPWVKEILKFFFDFLGDDIDEPMWLEW